MKRKIQWIIETADELVGLFALPRTGKTDYPNLEFNETVKIIIDTSSHVITLQAQDKFADDFCIDEGIDVWELLKALAEKCNIKIYLT